MERVNHILNNSIYQRHVGRTGILEENRVFCKHDMGHFMDVARIAMILNLEESLHISKDWIYAAGLLHDVGRDEQYDIGTPHEIASGKIAPVILRECGFLEEEIKEIEEAIVNHRNKSIANEKNLVGILYRADKLSRSCFLCEAEKECNWKNGNKNIELRY